MVAQAACLVEGSNQHNYHHYYYHCHCWGGYYYYYYLLVGVSVEDSILLGKLWMDVSVGDARKVVWLRTVGDECVSCHGVALVEWAAKIP